MSEIKLFTKPFNGGIDTDTADEYLQANKKRYSLNLIASSVYDGEEGVVIGPKGNVLIPVELPEGRNRVIGSLSDENDNRFLYALWNSNGYNTWFIYDSVTNVITRLVQDITDGDGLFPWLETDLILGANIVDGDKLYWTVYGSDHHAGKINISKMLFRNASGYDDVIDRSTVLAFKNPPVYPPTAEYFTNSTRKSNNVYRNLFKFAIRYYYDDFEVSTFSDFSVVPYPEEEDVLGSRGVPLINNGIRVSFLTGGPLVRKIELVTKKTVEGTQIGSDWVSIAILDKDSLNISDDTQYTYDFYNDNAYLPINQEDVITAQSELPDFPKAQDYSGNILFYGNFKSGYPIVDADFSLTVEYEDLFVPDGVDNRLNSPFIRADVLDVWFKKSGIGGYRHSRVRLMIGSDVRRGNIFDLNIIGGSGKFNASNSYQSNLNDTATTVASYFRNWISTFGTRAFDITAIMSSGADRYFEFSIWNSYNGPYLNFTTRAVPVSFSSLKDTGNSVRNEKHGSSFRYGVMYEMEDSAKKTLVYATSDNLVSIANISELGGFKKVSTLMSINHKPPVGAKRWQVVRTNNLTKRDYIDILIQAKAQVKDSIDNSLYQDLMIGSLFTYQRINPNVELNYAFEKGDRVRLLKTYSDSTKQWTIATNVIDYEVMDYFPEVVQDVRANVTIDGTSEVAVGDTPDANNIGSYIRVGTAERLITGITSSKYQLDGNLTESTNNGPSSITYPEYQIINRRGVIRIKENPDYPIPVTPGTVYPLVEVYKPSISFQSGELDNYFEIGYKFEVANVNGILYHRGNVQDQTEFQPAVVKIGGLDNYVRNRMLPVNNSEKNTQLIYTSIEDKAYSDFYESSLTSYGRVNRLDDSRGVIHLEDSVIHSQNRLEGTEINGLSMFRNINRIDYNDKFGAIQRLMIQDSILYILKRLKTAYVPVRASIITDASGNTQILSASDSIIPKRLEYIPWNDGVGPNPESAFIFGNDLWMVNPKTSAVLRINGGSGQVVSSQFEFEKEVRDRMTAASINGAKIFGCFDPALGFCVWNVQGYDSILFNSPWIVSSSEIVPVIQQGSWNILSGPFNGSVSIVGDDLTYSPDTNYVGQDSVTYSAGSGIIRNLIINVVDGNVNLIWRPAGQYCVTVGGTRTGESGYSILEQFDTISQTVTGSTKPNVPTDPDYVAPVMNENLCPINLAQTRIGVLSADKNLQAIQFTIVTDNDVNIIVKTGVDFSGTTVAQTGLVGSGTHALSLPLGVGKYSMYIASPSFDYDEISVIGIKGAYFESASFLDIPNLVELTLDQSGIPASHNLVFNSIDISANGLLEKLWVINHKIPFFDFSDNNPLLTDIDLSYGSALQNVIVDDYSIIERFSVHESIFTSISYSTVYVNSLLSAFRAAKAGGGPISYLRYGLSNELGIRPSNAALSNYNYLVSNGVTVVGQEPIVNVSLNVTSNQSGPRTIDYTVTLGQAVSQDVVVEVSFSIQMVGGSIQGPVGVITIPAGQTSSSGAITTSNESLTINNYSASVMSVSPNPIGNFNIIY